VQQQFLNWIVPPLMVATVSGVYGLVRMWAQLIVRRMSWHGPGRIS